jgi:hypothetical protein
MKTGQSSVVVALTMLSAAVSAAAPALPVLNISGDGVSVSGLSSGADNSAAAPALPVLNIAGDGVSISGLSSGADFVVQFTVAFSSLVRGVGVFAGQPYHCAVHRFAGESTVPFCCGTHDDCSHPGCTKERPSPDVPLCEGCPPGRTLTYDHCKRHPEMVNVSALLAYAHAQAARGLIDPLQHLRGTPVYLYRGTKDACYLAGSLRNSQTFFDELGSSVLFNHTTPSAHSWPTDGWGTKCGSGVIENCGYDGPGAALGHIYGPLRPKAAAPPANLLPFDQTPFFSAGNNGTATYNATTPRATGLAPSGYVYVPTRCHGQGRSCRLHLSLHGCSVNAYYDDAVHHLGFQEWGEANDIVILFPRLQPHGGTKETQDGCWDGYGQTGVCVAPPPTPCHAVPPSSRGASHTTRLFRRCSEHHGRSPFCAGRPTTPCRAVSRCMPFDR